MKRGARIAVIALASSLLLLSGSLLVCCQQTSPAPAPKPMPTPAPLPPPSTAPMPVPVPAPPPSAEFQVISLSIDPVETTVGEIVSIAAVVENIGGSEDTYTVILSVDGITAETKETALITPDSSEVVTFSLIKDVSGTYEIDIGGMSSSLIVKTNEIVDYAESLNLPLDIVNELRVLGPEMDQYEKELIELVSGYSEPVQIKIVRQLTTDSKVSKEEVNALKYLWQFSEKIQDEFIDLGLDADVLNFLTMVSTLPDQDFAEYAVINKLCIQDRKLTDLESDFLGDPERYSNELLTQYLVDLGSIYDELADELRKLPDFKETSIKNLEATEDVLSLASNPERRTFFEAALSEGVKDRRKYCTSLQALVWAVYDTDLAEEMEPAEHEERVKQLRKEGADYFEIAEELGITYGQALRLAEREFILASVPSLVRFAWINSSTSQNYQSDRWKDFDEVVDRLNSPNMISIYILDNIPYSWERHDYAIYITPEEVFEKKFAVCTSFSRFALHCLIRNGYTYNDFDKYPDKAAVILEARNKQAKTSSESGVHVTCLYVENGKFYLIDNRGMLENQSLIKGPYNTIEEAADATYPFPDSVWLQYKFLDINMRTTKTVYQR